MQDIMPPLGAGAPLIQSYGKDGFRIAQRMYESAVIITETAVFAWDGILSLEALAPVFNQSPLPELLLIGTGARHTFLDPKLRIELKNRGLNIDTMDTGAACRTFNIVLGEGRRVAAALQVPI